MDINLMISIFPSLLSGAIITLKLLIVSMFFGLIIGLFFAILRINKNPIINKRLGELYINTKRIDLAKERLKTLSICNCQEYLILKNIIEKN